MTDPKRLFDCLEFQMEIGGKADMLAAKENGEWKKYSTAEVISIVDQLAAGLLESGASYGDGTCR